MKKTIIFTALTAVCAVSASGETLTISSRSGPWNPSLNPSLNYGINDQLAPVAISLREGDLIRLSGGTGNVSANGTNPLVGADGYAPGTPGWTAWAPANDKLGSSGTRFPSYYTPQSWPTSLMALMGAFANNSGTVVGAPFEVGSATTTRAVPSGATKLQLGANDDIFGDNTGSYSLTLDITQQPRLFGISIGVQDGAFLRGDKSATGVLSRLNTRSNWASPSLGNPDHPFLFQHGQGDAVAQEAQIRQALDQMQVRAGDTVIFYYNGHGEAGLDGNEPGILTNVPPLPGLFTHTGDEKLHIGNFQLSDDELTSIFSQPKWQGVRKVFMLDACYAGGFMGGNDEGDLERLDHAVLFASAREGAIAFGNPIPGLGFGEGLYTQLGLYPLLDNPNETFENSRSFLQLLGDSLLQQFGGQDLPLLALNGPGSTAAFGYSPYFGATPDMVLNEPVTGVPEPSTALFGLAGLLLSLGHRSRTRTKQ